MNSTNRFVRWQAILRDQLTFLNSLLLTIAIGAIGFSISALGQCNFYLTFSQKAFFTSSLIVLIASVALGILVGISRLRDFRLTLRKIQTAKSGADQDTDESNDEKIRFYGNITWTLFYIQTGFSFIGLLGLSIAFLMFYSSKLFLVF